MTTSALGPALALLGDLASESPGPLSGVFPSATVGRRALELPNPSSSGGFGTAEAVASRIGPVPRTEGLSGIFELRRVEVRWLAEMSQLLLLEFVELVVGQVA